MLAAPSFLSLIAALFYVPVAALCLAAMAAARRTKAPPWHRTSWLLIASLFIALIAWRLTGFEDYAREIARDLLRTEGALAERRTYQRALIAAFFVVITPIGMWAFYKAARGPRRKRSMIVKVALGAALAMLGLITLRLISLHAIDQILYQSIRLNWWGDLGLSLAILIAAALYLRQARAARSARP